MALDEIETNLALRICFLMKLEMNHVDCMKWSHVTISKRQRRTN